MASIADFEREKLEYQGQIDLIVAQLKDDPENEGLAQLLMDLQSAVDLVNESIAELKPKQASKPKPAEAAEPAAPEKWSRENHPAFKKAAPAEEEHGPVTYNVNDDVQVRWVTGDKAWYEGKITSMTGSSANPIYIVKFAKYAGSETVRSADIRPLTYKKWSDAPRVPAAPAGPPPAPAPGVVTSAGATVYAGAKRPAENAEEPAKPKVKKIKANKELEASKNKWQDFNAKSKFGKSNKKDSQFRTPQGVTGRVGFTGSGQAMRKDPTRSRHVYQVNDEE